jgi:hypothetical protein
MWDAVPVFFAMASILWFVAGVTRMARWWREEVGRTIMWLSATLFIAAVPQALHYTLGVTLSQVWFAWFYGAVWTAVGLIHWWRWWVYRRIQRAARGASSRDD